MGVGCVTIWPISSTFEHCMYEQTLLHLHLNFASMFEQTFEQTFSVSTDITI